MVVLVDRCNASCCVASHAPKRVASSGSTDAVRGSVGVANMTQVPSAAEMRSRFPVAPHDSQSWVRWLNGWPGTEAAGGWPMEYIASLDLWVTKRALDEGQHQYKFVVDESTWMHDAANGVTVDDGYGGYNSVLNLECGEAEQVAADFPSETRPKGFGYDNHAASAIVSSTHVEMYLRAAEELSERALRDLP